MILDRGAYLYITYRYTVCLDAFTYSHNALIPLMIKILCHNSYSKIVKNY